MPNELDHSLWGNGSLQLTIAARSVLVDMMRGITEFRPIAFVGWVTDQISGTGAESVHLGPGWGVGFYSSTQVPAGAIVKIDDIPFVFEASTAHRLSGATLDFDQGKFVVIERAT